MKLFWRTYVFYLLHSLSDASRAVLSNNGYSDVVIAISSEIPIPENFTAFSEQLKETWSKASDILYQATRKRSYFADITVLLPSAWNFTQAEDSSWQTYEDADFRIAPLNPFYLDGLPYTQQTGLCSEQGDYIRVTPDFVLNTNYAGQARALVAQWAQFRYGVFEEHGDSDGVYPQFYRNSENSIGATVCTNSKTAYSAKTASGSSCFINASTQVYDNTCTYELDFYFNPNSSLLSGLLEKDSIIHFCDGETHFHNIEAPSRHNALCNSRSAWEIISESDDFADGKNPPRNDITTTPKFSYVRYTNSDRYVLLMDTSQFMNSNLAEINSVIKEWVLSDIPENDSLAIITFSNANETVLDLTPVTKSNRKNLLQYVPTTAIGPLNADISQGVYAALEVLDYNAGIIVLITAGCNNTDTFSPNVLDDLREARSRLVIVTLPKENNAGGTSTHLSKLVDASQGASFAHDPRNFAKTLVVKNALAKALTYAAYPKTGVNLSTTTLAQTDFNGTVIEFSTSITIDNTTGSNVVFRVDYSNITDLESVSIGDLFSFCMNHGKRAEIPSQTNEYQKRNTDINDIHGIVDDYAVTVTVRELRMAQVLVKVTTYGNANAKYVLTVTSQGSTTLTPIDLKCRLLPGYHFDQNSSRTLRVEAEMTQGDWIVANVKVFAKIGGTNIEPLPDLELLDNGAGADVKARDGIYSRYVAHLKRLSETNDASVSVNCYAWNDGNAEVYVDKYLSFPVSNFTRVYPAGAAEVYYDEDFKPIRITDLRLVKLEDKTVSFEWTSPGKTLDQDGLAVDYKLWLGYAETAALLVNQSLFALSNVTKVEVDNPAAVPGEIQQASALLPDLQEGHTYFLSLALTDRISNETLQPSNIISVYIPIPDSGLSGGAIFGIVIGVTSLVILIVGIGYVVATGKARMMIR